MNAKTYNRINRLLASYSKLVAKLELAEAQIKTRQVNAATGLIPKHAAVQIQVTAIEKELRLLSDEFYKELFPDPDKRNHKTPFGTLQYHKASSLVVKDEEKAVASIRAACDMEAERAKAAKEPARFTVLQLLRTTVEPNKEALETLDDETLAGMGLRRKCEDKFKITPFTMKADKPAAEQKEAA